MGNKTSNVQERIMQNETKAEKCEETIKEKGNLQQTLQAFNLKSFREECLEAHNEKRRLHRVKDLKSNSEIDEIAQNYAEKLAQSDSLNHSSNKYNGERLGENLYMQGGKKMTGSLPVDSWYGEINQYNFENPNSSSGVTGHFTQLVWKGSKEIGIGCAKSSDGSYYVVANYHPSGNWVGEERENVFPQ